MDGEVVGEHAVRSALPGTEEHHVEVEEEALPEEREVPRGEKADRRVARLVEVDHEEKHRCGGRAERVVEDVRLPGGGVVVDRAHRGGRGRFRNLWRQSVRSL